MMSAGHIAYPVQENEKLMIRKWGHKFKKFGQKWRSWGNKFKKLGQRWRSWGNKFKRFGQGWMTTKNIENVETTS